MEIKSDWNSDRRKDIRAIGGFFLKFGYGMKEPFLTIAYFPTIFLLESL